MSKRKHNISYIKPEEPAFLRKLKESIGYKEGPTIDTKREVLIDNGEDEREDAVDEKPVVVVLKSGDLTADEADAFQKRKEAEEANVPADLSKPVIFRKKKPSAASTSSEVPKSKKSKKEVAEKSKLSFSVNEEEDS